MAFSVSPSLSGHRCKPFRNNRAAKAAGRRPCVVRASANPVAGDKFDYIIVGGGTAGCVLANKLTADGSKKVLVLEAGSGGDHLEVKVPAGITRLFKHPVLDWGLNTLLQPQLSTREVYMARGKLLGGSSCTNATLYHRGSASDYDAWGLDGWRSSDVLEWFMKAEDYKDAQSKYHGTSGTMKVEQPRYDNPLHAEFFKAAAAMGLPANPDFNDWSRPQTGYGEFQVTQEKGERADMYRQYLKPAMSRGNLKVITGAKTTKVHIDKAGGKPTARGVEFSTGGQFGERFSAEVKPSGEVIMCAGAVHTPHILMLSGIGSQQLLADHGIAAVADVPGVGANLQDHPAVLMAAKFKPEYDELAVTSQIYSKSNNIRIAPVLQYLFSKTGPLATTGCDHGAFVSTTGKGEPDLQIRFVAGCSLDPDGVSAYAKFGELKKQGLNWPPGITFQLLNVRPKSKGSIGLRSSDPFSMPAININYLTDKEGADMATLKAGIQMSREMTSGAAFAKYVEAEYFPGAAFNTDVAVEDYIRKSVHSGNAVVGTCRMGTSAAEGAVVSSSDLSVFGVEGLRVVDASVVPAIPGGQTGAVTVMVAERAAAMLVSGKGSIKSGGKQLAAV